MNNRRTIPERWSIAGYPMASLFSLLILSSLLFSTIQAKSKVTVDDDGTADYIDIQAAVDGEPDGTEITVLPGTYSGFVVEGRSNLKISGKAKRKETVRVTGSITVTTYRGTGPLTVGVIDSEDIEISGLTIQAGLTDPYIVASFDSTGKFKENDISGNTDKSFRGTGIAVFGTTGSGSVKIEKNTVHHYGEIGILVNAWDGVPVPGGVSAEIKRNTIVGTDFADDLRVQTGIEVSDGASAGIEKNAISENFQSGGSLWDSAGILIADAQTVTTDHNDIYNNQVGIAIQGSIDTVLLANDRIDSNERGIDTSVWALTSVEVKRAKIVSNGYGWLNQGTDGIVFDHSNLEKNKRGISTTAVYPLNPVASFDSCKIEKNTVIDVEQGATTLIFHKTKYRTYNNLGGGILIED